MTVGYGSVGTVASAAAQTVSVPYPTGITAGDGLVLIRGAKPDTTALVTPSGWTLLDQFTGGAGVFGNDTGPLKVAAYFREATGSESGNLVCDTTAGTFDVQQGYIARYTKGSGVWDIAVAGGADSTTTTDWSVTAGSDPGVQSGDLVQVGLCWPTDAARTWSAEGLTVPGTSVSALTVPLANQTTLVGADMASRGHNFTITAGTSTGAPTYAATVNSGINIAGPTIFVRLREVGGAAAVTLSPATLTLAAQQVTPVPQPVTVALTSASVALTAQPLTPVSAPVTVALSSAAVTLAAVPVVAAPGAVTVDLVPGAMSLTAQPVDADPGPVAVTLSPAGMTLSATPVDGVPQPVAVTLTPTVVTLEAVPVGPSEGAGARTGRGRVRIPAGSTVRTPAGSGVRIL